MLRDNVNKYNPPAYDDLSASPNHEVTIILTFIDNNISGFRPYYLTFKDSERENRISDYLVQHFQLCKNEQSDGYSPYDFRKNPTQPYSGKETDIGVFVLTRSTKPLPIIEFEAKRFSRKSHNKEYVCGVRGGIERFKRGHHSSHLTVCGMFAYVQSRTSSEWIQNVNTWIDELSKDSIDTTIDWNSQDERMSMIINFPGVEKLRSKHNRKPLADTILLWHYFIDLC